MEPDYALKLCKLQNFLTDKTVGQLHKYICIMIEIFRKCPMHQYISQYLCLKFYQQDIQLAQDSIPSFKSFQSKCKCPRQYIILSPQKEIFQQIAGRKSLSGLYHKFGKHKRKMGKMLKGDVEDANLWLFQSLVNDELWISLTNQNVITYVESGRQLNQNKKGTYRIDQNVVTIESKLHCLQT